MRDEEQLRERLAETLRNADELGWLFEEYSVETDIADALLPVVRAYADQRAAEVLREASDRVQNLVTEADRVWRRLRALGGALAADPAHTSRRDGEPR